MAITSRLCLTLAIALAVVSTFSHNVYALAAEAAPVPPNADVADDNFNYEQYQSPPIWSRMFILFSTSRQTPHCLDCSLRGNPLPPQRIALFVPPCSDFVESN